VHLLRIVLLRFWGKRCIQIRIAVNSDSTAPQEMTAFGKKAEDPFCIVKFTLLKAYPQEM